MVALCDFDCEDALFLLKTSAFHVHIAAYRLLISRRITELKRQKVLEV